MRDFVNLSRCGSAGRGAARRGTVRQGLAGKVWQGSAELREARLERVENCSELIDRCRRCYFGNVHGASISVVQRPGSCNFAGLTLATCRAYPTSRLERKNPARAGEKLFPRRLVSPPALSSPLVLSRHRGSFYVERSQRGSNPRGTDLEPTPAPCWPHVGSGDRDLDSCEAVTVPRSVCPAHGALTWSDTHPSGLHPRSSRGTSSKSRCGLCIGVFRRERCHACWLDEQRSGSPRRIRGRSLCALILPRCADQSGCGDIA